MAKKAPTRERMEEAEARSEEKYGRLPEPASDAVLTVTRPAGKIVDANAAAAEMLGYSLPELIGLLIPREIVAPEVLEQTQREGVSQILENGHYRLETVWVRKDGSRIPVKTSGKPITLEGRPLLHLIARDITERKGTEEELKESEERLKVLFEFAPDAYYLNDLQGTFVDGNAAAEEITGYKREELIGKSFLTLQLLSPEEVPKAAAVLANNVAGQPTGPDEFTLNRKDGSQVTVEIRTFPVRIKNQTLVLGIARDVTERKRAEEALRKAHDELEIRVQERTSDLVSANKQLQEQIAERERAEEAVRQSEKRVAGILDSLNDVVWSVSTITFETLYLNRAAESVYGRPVAEFFENRNLWLEVIHPEDRKRFAKSVQASLKEESSEVEYRILRPDGEVRWLLGRGHLARDASGRLIRIEGILRDITERKRMEEALQAARDELEGKVERQLLRRNPYGLTFRELTVLHLVAVGESDKQIGLKLGISHFTAQKHTSNILAKMSAGSRTEAASRALREGLLD